MTQQPDYKTLADGSIDYAYYDHRTRDLRAQSFRAAMKSLLDVLTSVWRRDSTQKATPPARVTHRAGRTYRSKSPTTSRQGVKGLVKI